MLSSDEERICIACTVSYTPSDDNQKHCSNLCKKYMYHLRRYGLESAEDWMQIQKSLEIPWDILTYVSVPYVWEYVVRYGEIFAQVEEVEELVEWWLSRNNLIAIPTYEEEDGTKEEDYELYF